MTKQEFLAKAANEGYTKTGESEYASGMNNEMHTHDFAFCALVLEGEFRLVTEDTTQLLGPGQLWSLEAGVVHSEEVIGTHPVKFVYGVR